MKIISHFILMSFLGFLPFIQSIPEEKKALNNIRNEFVKNASKMGYNCLGTGAQAPVKYEKLKFYFITDDTYSVERGRTDIIEMTEKLLKDLNANEKVQSLFSETPITRYSISISLIFNNPKRIDPDHLYHAVVWHHHDDNIRYEIVDPITLQSHKFTEPYPEAYEKVYGHSKQ